MKVRARRRPFDFAAVRRREIERDAIDVGAATTEDFWRWAVAWCWHNSQSKDPVYALVAAVGRMGGSCSAAEAEDFVEQAKATHQRRKAHTLASSWASRTSADAASASRLSDPARHQRSERRWIGWARKSVAAPEAPARARNTRPTACRAHAHGKPRASAAGLGNGVGANGVCGLSQVRREPPLPLRMTQLHRQPSLS